MPDSALTEFIKSDGASGAGNGGASRADGPNAGGPSPFDGGRVPQRTYMTGMMIALGAIFMFFVALASASIVRKGLAQCRLATLRATAHSLAQHAGSSSVAASRWRIPGGVSWRSSSKSSATGGALRRF